jgi:hypothetical protein
VQPSPPPAALQRGADGGAATGRNGFGITRVLEGGELLEKVRSIYGRRRAWAFDIC